MKGRAVAFLLGARTRSELLFPEILRDCCPLLIATDDGSFGHHGFVIDLLKQVDPAAADAICVCGPERMMVAVFEILKEERMLERSYFSLHRYEMRNWSLWFMLHGSRGLAGMQGWPCIQG